MRLGSILEAFWDASGHLGSVFEAFCVLVGISAQNGAKLASKVDKLSIYDFGGSGDRRWQEKMILECLGGVFKASWARLRPSQERLEELGGLLERSLEPSWGCLGRFGVSW